MAHHFIVPALYRTDFTKSFYGFILLTVFFGLVLAV